MVSGITGTDTFSFSVLPARCFRLKNDVQVPGGGVLGGGGGEEDGAVAGHCQVVDVAQGFVVDPLDPSIDQLLVATCRKVGCHSRPMDCLERRQ